MNDLDQRHAVRRATQARFAAPGSHVPGASGLTRWSVVDEHTAGAVHTGFGVCALAARGSVPAHLHSYEEAFFVLTGAAVLRTSEGTVLLRPGDYGFVPVGMPHSWHNDGPGEARWADMLAPQPRARHGGDTIAIPESGLVTGLAAAGLVLGLGAGIGVRESPAAPVDARDPRTRWFGHIEPANTEVGKQTQDLLAVSASMRTALLVYSGITVKMMVDSDLGAQLATMFMVQYEPDGVAGLHDHPFEETYMFLEGEVEATFDGHAYRLGPGDVAFAGVGCVHGFRNVGSGPVRWLETQAPQPPRRYSYRFVRDWDYLREALYGKGDGR